MPEADEMDFQTNGVRQLLARGNVTLQPDPELLAELEISRRDLERANSIGAPRHPDVLNAKMRVTKLESQLQRIQALAAQGHGFRLELGLARPCLADRQDCSELFAPPANK
jgi:capsule polysaccharide export protein KpsE/RkpR